MKHRFEYDKTITTKIPADYHGKSLDDDGVLADVVASGMGEVPGVVRNHIHGRFNDLAFALEQDSPQARYEAAVKLAGIALRYAWENRIRNPT